MKKLELKQMEKIEGGKFWGTGTKTTCKTTNLLNGDQTCVTCSYDYMFWIRVSSGYNCHE